MLRSGVEQLELGPTIPMGLHYFYVQMGAFWIRGRAASLIESTRGQEHGGLKADA